MDRSIKTVNEESKVRLSMDFVSGQWLPRAPPYKVVRKPRLKPTEEQVFCQHTAT